MVAADGKKRTYLLLIMNNAEVRSLAGMPGSFAEITARTARWRWASRAASTRCGRSEAAAGRADQGRAERVPGHDRHRHARHGHPPGLSAGRRTCSGHRRKAVEGEVRRRHGHRPVAMGYMLSGARSGRHRRRGDHQLQQRRLDVAQRGLHEVPHRCAQAGRRLREAARRIFDADGGGHGRLGRCHPGIRARGDRAAADAVVARRRPSRNGSRRSGIAGSLDTGSGRPRSASTSTTTDRKMEYFLAMGTRVRSEQCFDGGSQELRITTTSRPTRLRTRVACRCRSPGSARS